MYSKIHWKLMMRSLSLWYHNVLGTVWDFFEDPSLYHFRNEVPSREVVHGSDISEIQPSIISRWRDMLDGGNEYHLSSF